MRISGHTKPFAVLGHPIGHSLSPVMHNAGFQSVGLDALYTAYNVSPDALMTVLEGMRAMGFAGVNLTIPLKEVAFQHLVALDESARLLGAVNTVAFTENGLVGHNTDGVGFLKAVEEAFGRGVEGDTVTVLGTGGAGRAVALVAARAGAKSVVLADLDEARLQRVAAEVRQAAPSVSTKTVSSREEQLEAASQSELIIQATPIGMKSDDPVLLSPEVFSRGQRVFDLIYMYPKTRFLKQAEEAGADVANGLGMLLHQGAKA